MTDSPRLPVSYDQLLKAQWAATRLDEAKRIAGDDDDRCAPLLAILLAADACDGTEKLATLWGTKPDQAETLALTKIFEFTNLMSLLSERLPVLGQADMEEATSSIEWLRSRAKGTSFLVELRRELANLLAMRRDVN